MASNDAQFRRIRDTFRDTSSQDDLDRFSSTTLEDVHRTITNIQARQEAERTMMDLTRVQEFLEKMVDLANIMRILPEHKSYMILVWGPVKMMLSLTNQIPKAFDIVLDAYERLGKHVPTLQQFQVMFESFPDLWRIVELVYEDVLQFHQSILRIATHPNTRTLFRSMWSDYVPCFTAKLKNLESHGILLREVTMLNDTHLSLMANSSTNIQLVAGNVYGNIDVNNAQAYIGDNYCLSSQTESITHEVSSRLANFEIALEQANATLTRQEQERLGERRAKVRDWIAGPDPWPTHEKARNDHLPYPETGSWVLSNESVAAWMKDDLPQNPMLWMHGIPGAGKTVLASVIIDECEKLENSRIAYFYCDYHDQRTSTAIAILNSLLNQAINWRPELFAYFDDQRQQGGEPTIRKQKTAERLIELVCHGGPRTYIVVDGIDECAHEERKLVLTFMTKLVQEVDQKDPGRLRVLIISQDEADIRKTLNTATELEIQKDLNGSDISIFAKRWSEKIGAHFGLEDYEVTALHQIVCWRAAGQFLYAKLVLENLYAQPNVKGFRHELEGKRFPTKLSEAYDRIIARIKNNTGDDEWIQVQQLLGWMTCAARPLKWHEMQAALSINFTAQTVEFEELSMRRHIFDICGALVTVRGDRISLVHMTAKRYITESKPIEHPNIECRMANLCIRYLCLPWFEIKVSPKDLRDFVLEGYFGFADYAAAKWTHHLYKVVDQASELLDENCWTSREDDVNEVFETIQEFSHKFQDDLDTSQADAEKRCVTVQLQPDMIALLKRSSIDDAESSFRRVWMHAEAVRTGDIHARHIVTLESLRNAIENTREALEELFSDTSLPQDQVETLKTYYGNKVYRCPKTSCFFFHEGFEDRKTRDAHVTRHERPFYCPEADCPAADFGFGSKKDMEAHIREAHPDSEMKAKLFKIVKAIPKTNTKYICHKCDKYFARNSILQAHERSHAGQKPFECSKCGRAFTRKSDCGRHEKSVHRMKVP